MRAIYRLLLCLAPRSVRQRYAADMQALILECLARERHRRGRLGYFPACAAAIADGVLFVIRSHWQQFRSRPLEPRDRRSRRTSVVAHDIRGTVRLMKAQPVLSTAIVAMLALGIGATTAIFSVVYGVLLKPLPFPEPERIVQVWGTLPSRGWNRASLTEANFWDLHDRNRTFESIGALGYGSFSLTGFEMPERLGGARVTTGFFRSLGVTCVVGRLFEPGEDEPGRGEGLVLLSHRFWSRRFDGDRNVVGRSITLDNRPHSIVGVLPPGTPWLDEADVFVPFIRRPNANRGSFEYMGVGRIKAGVSPDAALADLMAISKDLELAYPKENTGLQVVLAPSSTWIATDQLRRTLWILLGSVGLLLLIACLNVTNLLLVRASARMRENAVRSALGASRSDLVRERLIESLIYSALGTVLGWFMASWMVTGLQSLPGATIPRLGEVALNGWVLAFAAGAALAVGLVTGLIPAWRTPVGDVAHALRHGARGSAGDRSQSRLRNLFVTAEVAIALVLLVGAGLLVKSLLGVLSVERGFQTDNRLFATISVPASYGDEKLARTNDELLRRLGSHGEIASVAAVSSRPLSSSNTGMGIAAADKSDPPEGAVPWASWRIVTPDYFKTVGVPLVAGRGFTDQDMIAKPWKVVISRRTADLLWPEENPIGRTAILWKGQNSVRGEVIGVVGNMRERGLDGEPTLAVYFPAGGAMNRTTLQLVLHTKGRPQDVIPAMRTIVAAVDPNLPISNIRTFDEVVNASLSTRRMTMWLLATFAGLALVLALAGVYGVLAYSVTRRTSEIGVRLALGAAHGTVLRSVVAQGMRPVLIGAGLGLAVAIATSRLMANMLFEVQPRDPATYGAVTAIVSIVALLACYVPARRVLRVDPAIALRAD